MWDTIKNIAALAGLFLTLTSLWVLFHKRLKLKAKITRSLFRPFPQTEEHAIDFQCAFDEAERRERHSQAASTPIADLAQKLPTDIFKKGNMFKGGDLFQFKNVCEIEIHNLGKVEVSDLLITVPVDVGMYIADQPGNDEPIEFKRTISVKTLRGRHSIKVTVWVDYWTFNNNDLKITHSNGIVPIQFGKILYGRTAVIAEFLSSSAGPASLSILVGIIMGTLFAGTAHFSELRNRESRDLSIQEEVVRQLALQKAATQPITMPAH